MPKDILLGPTLEGVAAALTVHSRRHAVLATNVANLETPGFRAVDTDFRHLLQRAFTDQVATAPLPAPQETLIPDTSVPPRADGNTVDLDLQMAKLADNTSRYSALTRILGKRLALVRTAIDGSR